MFEETVRNNTSDTTRLLKDFDGSSAKRTKRVQVKNACATKVYNREQSQSPLPSSQQAEDAQFEYLNVDTSYETRSLSPYAIHPRLNDTEELRESSPLFLLSELATKMIKKDSYRSSSMEPEISGRYKRLAAFSENKPERSPQLSHLRDILIHTHITTEPHRDENEPLSESFKRFPSRGVFELGKNKNDVSNTGENFYGLSKYPKEMVSLRETKLRNFEKFDSRDARGHDFFQRAMSENDESGSTNLKDHQKQQSNKVKNSWTSNSSEDEYQKGSFEDFYISRSDNFHKFRREKISPAPININEGRKGTFEKSRSATSNYDGYGGSYKGCDQFDEGINEKSIRLSGYFENTSQMDSSGIFDESRDNMMTESIHFYPKLPDITCKSIF
ncbi:hypothetical protein AX774_g1827 [Zancudomyces culisetae]|uniref:Uncharacterized protein n=1 Tax=Zancudomyces culisetae TaxID=1213189 RepID=A0A1R1PUS5_ZANCU|nr:hypothetical protein AX774_g1827 [Zancudomyces culisetae]|eukprot:OMH84642.1 hypothetical protein AX774_g1827 [Zancudomyces culisetae]